MKRLCTLLLILALLPCQAWGRLGGGSSYSSSRSSSRSYSSPSRSYSSPSRSYSSGSRSYSSGSRSSYSSGGSSYSSGSSSSVDNGTFIATLVFMALVLFLLFCLAVVLSTLMRGVQAVANYKVRGPTQEARREQVGTNPLAVIRGNDPNFSEPVFKSFVHLLFARFHNERGKNNLASLSAYLAPALLGSVRALGPVSDVLVGASRYLPMYSRADLPHGYDGIVVELEATLTEAGKDYYTVEQWVLARKRGVLSKDPEAMLNLGCPSCGNPGELGKDGRCPFCDQVVNQGTFQWQVVRRTVNQFDAKPPIQLEGGSIEEGTEHPTIFQQNFEGERRAFVSRHPQFSWDELRDRIVSIFLNLQQAWSSLDFDKARPFETDVLYDTHRYWIDRYRDQGLQNRLENVQVAKVIPCRIDRDAFYETLTVRIFASMLDYTVDKEGRLVSGDRSKPRIFSEYWTFLRRVGAPDKVTKELFSCPRCGAPLEVSQAGICQNCEAKVSSGQFDWVLSSIEQDESYGTV